jgi:hypothetical protein
MIMVIRLYHFSNMEFNNLQEVIENLKEDKKNNQWKG